MWLLAPSLMRALAQTFSVFAAGGCERREGSIARGLASPYVGYVKRLVGRVLGLYLLFAVIGRFVEGVGAVECGCSPTCWCRRPVLSTFRWVFPFAHRCP